jgi:hypothetical protein
VIGHQQHPNLPDPCQRPADRPANGTAVAGMVLGLLAVVLAWLGLIALGLSIAAVICGAIGVHRSASTGAGRGQGIAGVVLGVAGLVAYIFLGAISLGVMLLV